MSFFRSEDMKLFMLRARAGDAKEVLEKFGEFSCLHFIDVSESGEKKTFYNVVRRCEEMKAAIKYIEQCCYEYEIPLEDPEKWDDYYSNTKIDVRQKGKNSMTYFEETENTIKNGVSFLKAQYQKMENATDELKKLIDKNGIFKAAARFFETHNM